MTPIPAFIGLGGMHPMELAVVGIIALLLFGKKLPDVARSMGKGIVEFKKGIRGIEDEVEQSTYARPASRPIPAEERDEVTAPKFEPPKSEPTEAQTA